MVQINGLHLDGRIHFIGHQVIKPGEIAIQLKLSPSFCDFK